MCGLVVLALFYGYKTVSWMKKGLEDLIDLLVYFSFVFVIDVIVYFWVV